MVGIGSATVGFQSAKVGFGSAARLFRLRAAVYRGFKGNLQALAAVRRATAARILSVRVRHVVPALGRGAIAPGFETTTVKAGRVVQAVEQDLLEIRDMFARVELPGGRFDDFCCLMRHELQKVRLVTLAAERGEDVDTFAKPAGHRDA